MGERGTCAVNALNHVGGPCASTNGQCVVCVHQIEIADNLQASASAVPSFGAPNCFNLSVRVESRPMGSQRGDAGSDRVNVLQVGCVTNQFVIKPLTNSSSEDPVVRHSIRPGEACTVLYHVSATDRHRRADSVGSSPARGQVTDVVSDDSQDDAASVHAQESVVDTDEVTFAAHQLLPRYSSEVRMDLLRLKHARNAVQVSVARVRLRWCCPMPCLFLRL